MAEIKQIKTTDGVVHDIEPANTLGLQVTNSAPTLAWDTTSTIGTIDGVALTVKMPANPDTKVTVDSALSSTSTNPVQNKVVNTALGNKVTANAAITGATKCKITYDSKGLVTSGANLAASDIPSLASNKITAMTDYAKPSSTSAIAATDSLNAAIGKLEKALDGKQASGSYLTSHQTIVQDGIVGASVYNYAVCETAAGTAAKTANILLGEPKNLPTGLRVIVKFTAKNTANNPTFNLNSFGAKNIFHNGAQITSGTNKGLLYGACELIYDGTQWLLVGNYVDTNTTYSSASAVSGGTAVSLVTTGEKYTWNNKASTAAATTAAAGLMSAADKTKLDGIATGANKVTQASATGNTTTVASNSHVHSVTASGTLNSTGSHSHTVTALGTLNSTGSHSHTLTVTASTQTLTYVSGLGTTPCTSASSHTHSITATASTITNNITGSYSNGVLTLSSGNITYVSAVTQTGSAGGHSHTISLATTNQTIATGISSATSTATGSHSHTFTGSSVNTNETGSHSHTFTGSAVNSATPSGTTATTTVPTSGHTHGLA